MQVRKIFPIVVSLFDAISSGEAVYGRMVEAVPRVVVKQE
jgi:hypothetical protein